MKRTAQDYAAELSALSPIEIPKARWKLVLACLIFLPCCVLFGWAFTLPGVSRPLVGGLLALFVLVTAYAALLVVRPPVLRLDREGFSVKTRFTDVQERWAGVDQFQRVVANRAMQVGYRMLRDPKSKSEALALKLTGGQGFVGAGYSLSTKELAALMQAYRDRAVRSGGSGGAPRAQAVEWVPPAHENYQSFAHLSR